MWGQTVIVDHRPGGNTIIGSMDLVKSDPDGYTIMLQASTLAINPSVLTLPYDTVKDFAPVASVTSNEYMLVVPQASAANDLQQFIALAKSKPGELNYASTGTASTQHLAAELFSVLTGVKLQHVPYRGSGQIMPDLIAGRVQLAFTNPVNALPYVGAGGHLKALAVSGPARLPAFPQGSHFFGIRHTRFRSLETGLGVFAPAGTPRPIIDKLHSGLAAIMAMPDVREETRCSRARPVRYDARRIRAIDKGRHRQLRQTRQGCEYQIAELNCLFGPNQTGELGLFFLPTAVMST